MHIWSTRLLGLPSPVWTRLHCRQTPLRHRHRIASENFSEMSENNMSDENLEHLPSKKLLQKGRSSVLSTWHLTLVILGILCFVLLLTIRIMEFKVLQCHQKCQSHKPPLDNVIQEDNSAFKNRTFKEERRSTGNKYGTCEGKWSCCGEKCYYFSNEEKNFEESKKSCKKMNSTLLKIEDEKELKFIQGQLSYFSWIGLSREGTSTFWKWEDGSRPNLKIISNWQESKNGNCAMMATRKMVPSDCSRYFHYVCEKQVACLAT